MISTSNNFNISNKSSFDISIQDGFQDYFKFNKHRLNIRGFNIVDFGYDRYLVNLESAKKQIFISWDVKQLYLWECNLEAPTPVLVQQIKFPQPNFLSAMIISQKMKVFVAAALDASFKIYDKKLNLLESIRHEERAILQLEYDTNKDIILAAGASGVSVWRVYRNLSLDKAFVMEKMYTFDDCTEWVSKMIYDPKYSRIYAIQETNAKILCLTTRNMVEELQHTHDAPLNCVCWYERNQFYITGCSRGEIKCWSSHHNSTIVAATGLKTTESASSVRRNTMTNPSSSSLVVQSLSNQFPLTVSSAAGGGGNKPRFALFHVFQGHGKAVTSILLHPTPGLAVTTGMDGVIKVLNLESLTELFCIHIEEGILEMKIVQLNNNKKGLLLSQTNSVIRFMKVSTTTQFFGTCNSDIKYLEQYENIELKTVEKFREIRIERLHQQRLNDAKRQALLANQAESYYLGDTNSMLKSDENKLSAQTDHVIEYKEEEEELLNESYEHELKYESIANGNISYEDKLILAYSSQDVRVFASNSKLIARMEAEHVVDGIKSMSISVYQSLLFCLFDNDRIKIFSLKDFTMPFLKEISIRSSSYGEESEDIGSCLVLIDELPIYSIRNASNNQKHKRKNNVAGVNMPSYLESFLLVGMKNGTISFLDSLSDSLENQMHFQAHNGIITSMHYRSNLKELFVLGKGLKESSCAIHIWRFPQVEFLYEITDLFNISSFGFSPSRQTFAIGTTIGNIRLYKTRSKEMMEQDDKVTASIHNAVSKAQVEEINSSTKLHDTEVLSISFCDELSVFVSSSSDGTIKIWNYKKQLIRSLRLSKPSSGSIFNGQLGDVLVVQGTYLLSVLKLTWNDGNAIDQLQNQIDPWTDSTALLGITALEEDKHAMTNHEAVVGITKQLLSEGGDDDIHKNQITSSDEAANINITNDYISSPRKFSNQIPNIEKDRKPSEAIATNRSNSINSIRSSSISVKRKPSILQRRETKVSFDRQTNNSMVDNTNANVEVDSNISTDISNRKLIVNTSSVSTLENSQRNRILSISRNTEENSIKKSHFQNQSNSLFTSITNQFQEAFVTQKKSKEINNNNSLFNHDANFPKLVVIRPSNYSNQLVSNTDYLITSSSPNNTGSILLSNSVNQDDIELMSSTNTNVYHHNNNNNSQYNTKQISSRYIDVMHPRYLIRTKASVRDSDLLYNELENALHLVAMKNKRKVMNETTATTLITSSLVDHNGIASTIDFANLSNHLHEEKEVQQHHVTNDNVTDRQLHSDHSNPNEPNNNSNNTSTQIKSWNISQKFAQLSLSPRARLTLLSSHQLGLGADANEELESILHNKASMEVSMHYRQHKTTIEGQREASFKKLYQKHGFVRSRIISNPTTTPQKITITNNNITTNNQKIS